MFSIRNLVDYDGIYVWNEWLGFISKTDLKARFKEISATRRPEFVWAVKKLKIPKLRASEIFRRNLFAADCTEYELQKLDEDALEKLIEELQRHLDVWADHKTICCPDLSEKISVREMLRELLLEVTIEPTWSRKYCPCGQEFLSRDSSEFCNSCTENHLASLLAARDTREPDSKEFR